eukprot:2474012-Prymnesium_polylepis.2
MYRCGEARVPWYAVHAGRAPLSFPVCLSGQSTMAPNARRDRVLAPAEVPTAVALRRVSCQSRAW